MAFLSFTRSVCVAAFALFATHSHAQVIYNLPVDINQGIQAGQITVLHSPLDIGVIAAAFDGISAPDNVARSAAVNPMVVTLVFPYDVVLTATSVYTSNVEQGTWTVEAAGSAAELDQHTGTYAVLVDQAPYSTLQTATAAIPVTTARALRLTMHRLTGDNYVHLGEWGLSLMAAVEVDGLCMRPNSVRLVPGATFEPNWYATDAQGYRYPVPASQVTLASADPAVVSNHPAGVFTATGPLGQTAVTASWNGITLEKNVRVVSDFVSPTAEKRVARVALVIIDPPIPAAGGQRFSQVFWSWLGGPMALAQQVRDSMNAVSGGAVEYQFVEIHDEPGLLMKFAGTPLTVDSLYHLFQEPNWTTLHYVAETLGQSEFLYNELLAKYDLCAKSNDHLVDEVWVYAMPFIGMGEAAMTGDGAFWINGPVFGGNACTDLLPIMGFNYERYAGCALHNFAHRVETTLYHVLNAGIRYVPGDAPYPADVPLNPFQLFTLYDTIAPGEAHVGNGHFPPNGVENYDYDNPNTVTSHAPAWKRYPYLFDDTEPVNCSAWGCEIDCGLNFTSWWLRRLPHFRCADKTGLLNNWWSYIIDYNEGRALETQLDACDCKMFDDELAAEPNIQVFNWTLIAQGIPGETRNTTFDLVNAGSEAVTSPFSVGIFLSTDNLWGPNDQLLAMTSYPGLPPGTLANQALVFTVPAGALPGDYYVILRADFTDQVAEPVEADNTAVGTFTVTPADGGNYCASHGDFPWHDWIARVQLADLDRSSGKSPYSDFIAQTAHVTAGTTVPITLTTGFSWQTFDEYWKVWIDLNRNGIFDDPLETMAATIATRPANGTPQHSTTVSIQIPGYFTEGFTTRLRVAMKRDGYPLRCEIFAHGEVEDYTIDIAPANGVADLELTLVADQSDVPLFYEVAYTVQARNTGNQTVAAATIALGICSGANGSIFGQATQLVYAGTPAQPTQGTFNAATQRWTLQNLQPGHVAVLPLKLFTLTTQERTVLAYTEAQSPDDPDSQPGSWPGTCSVTQDDEATRTINAGRSQPRHASVDRRETGALRLYPNPTSNLVHVEWPAGWDRSGSLTVYDGRGARMLERHVDNTHVAPVSVDVSRAPAGAYTVRIVTPDGRTAEARLVVVREE